MSLKSLIVPSVSARILGEDRLMKARAKAEGARVAAGAPHRVEFFHDPSDPYSHLLQSVPMFARGADEAFGGPVTVAQDGLIVRLPANSDAVVYQGPGAR